MWGFAIFIVLCHIINGIIVAKLVEYLMSGMWKHVLFIAGCLVVGGYSIIKSIQFLMLLKHYFFGYFFGYNPKLLSYGKWCLITGCTDGIGRAYSFALAKRGHNLILVSRTLKKLEKLSEELKKEFPIETKILVVDFKDGSEETYKRIEDFVEDIEIGILINNVGMFTNHRSIFTEIPDRNDFFKDMINVNIVAMTFMTSIILPQMEQRRNGLILNISSKTATIPLPLLNIYGAAKAYMDYLSQALHMEYKDKGIYIQSVLPGLVSTKMSNQTQSLISPSPHDYVEAQLRTIGGDSQTYGYFWHSFTAFFMRIPYILPAFIRDRILLNAMKKV